MTNEINKMTDVLPINILIAHFPNDLTPEQKLQLERGIESFKREQEKIVEHYISTAREEFKGSEITIGSRMTNDTWLSKNIRPMALIFLLTLFAIFILAYPFIYGEITNEGQAKVVEHSLSIMADVITVIFAFYFGGRTIEKVTKIIKEHSSP